MCFLEERLVFDVSMSVVSDVFSAAGMLMTACGAGVAARAVVVSEEAAVQIGVSRFSSENPMDNLKLPMVRNLLAASRGAQWGFWFIFFGTALQLVPVLHRLLR